MTAAGGSRDDFERLFLENLASIERIIRKIARRHALSRDDRDDFASWAHLKIIEHDYRVLRAFKGHSTLSTFLTVVISREFGSYCNDKWGRWRPSAVAQRMGPIAVALERHLVRDKCPLQVAINMLLSAGVDATEEELRRMAAALPRRLDHGEVDIDTLESVLSDHSPTRSLTPEERERVLVTLRDAIETLPAEDLVITRMYFWDDVSIADIARRLQLEQKPLYRRLKAICVRLRELLRRAGIPDEIARDVLREEEGW